MKKCIVAIFVFSFFQSMISYSAGRMVDPLTLTLDQFLSDITLEIVPCPTYPACPPDQSLMPYPTNPYICVDGSCQCGWCPECSNLNDPIECGLYPPCPNFLDMMCGLDTCSTCSCYRDMREPCIIYEDPGTLSISFECFEGTGSSPYIYFPPVEYPMSAMDIRPYYYGNCWCT